MARCPIRSCQISAASRPPQFRVHPAPVRSVRLLKFPISKFPGVAGDSFENDLPDTLATDKWAINGET